MWFILLFKHRDILEAVLMLCYVLCLENGPEKQCPRKTTLVLESVTLNLIHPFSSSQVLIILKCNYTPGLVIASTCFSDAWIFVY